MGGMDLGKKTITGERQSWEEEDQDMKRIMGSNVDQEMQRSKGGRESPDER